jgi:hypothetical protein
MASALCLLGRGERQRSIYALTHIACAAAGGAVAGLGLGAVGASLPNAARTTLVVATLTLAAYLSIRPPATGTGLHRQVARQLERRLRPLPAYAVWGAELGSGLTTLIPYSAFLLVLAVELLSGPILGAAAGASFGVARQGVAAVAAYRSTSPAPIMALLPRLAAQARQANLMVCFVGSTALIAEMIR